MTDPKRLLSGTAVGEEAELEQRLFSSIRDVSAPPSAKAQGWDAIAGELGIAAGAAIATGAMAGATGTVPPPAPPAAPLATGFLHSLAGKVIVGLAVSGTAAAGGAWVVHRASQPAPVPVTAPAPVEAADPPATPADPAPAAEGEARGTHGVARPPAKDGLRVEGGMLTEARARLRAGNPRGALALLEQIDQRFPKGALMQEREVLAIQALEAAGDADGAARRARAFLKAYPGSPHAPLLRHLAGGP